MHDQTIPLGTCQCGCGQESGVYARTNPAHGHIAGEPRRFIKGHAVPKQPRWELDPRTGCWVWQGAFNSRGYGFLYAWPRGTTGGKRRVFWLAHRWVYEQQVGPIPEGMTIDHLCCNPACVRPHHFDIVSQPVNASRAALRGRLPKARFTHAEVREIRRRAGTGETSTAIARELDVTPSAIRAIANRRNYAHVV